MNLNFDIETNNVKTRNVFGLPETQAYFAGYPARLRRELENALDRAIGAGYEIAKAKVPRNTLDPDRNRGRTLADAIQVFNTRTVRGGVGGGATMSKALGLNQNIAPHARFVIEGTGDRLGGAQRRIKPRYLGKKNQGARESARAMGIDIFETVGGNLDIKPRSKRAMAFSKDGEGQVVRKAVSGQAPQRLWWDFVEAGVEREMRDYINEFFGRNAFRTDASEFDR